MNNLEIISLTKSSLEEALNENKYWNGSYEPPFSENKAKWLLENNRADDNDVLATLCYENFTIVAFIYLVPDWIKKENGGVKKVFWSQRWWVADKYKDTVLSTYTKQNSLKDCKNQVVIRFLGDNTKAYYEKLPFTKFSKRKRYIIIFSLDYQLLVYKKSSLKKIAPLLKFLDGFSRRIIGFVNTKKSRNRNKSITSQSIIFLNDNIWNFIKEHCKDDIVPKTKEYINWQINNNQYHLLTDEEERSNYKCLLGSISEKKYNLNLVIKNGNKVVGFISGFVSGNRFNVRYFIASKSHFKECLNILVRDFIKSKCTLLQTENSALGESLKRRYFNVYTDTKDLVSLVHNDVDIDMKNYKITDQDGNFF